MPRGQRTGGGGSSSTRRWGGRSSRFQGGGGNGFRADNASDGGGSELGLLEKIQAARGTLHLSKAVNVPGTSISWDNRDGSANRVDYDPKLFGNDSMAIHKLRIAGVARSDGTTIGPIAANGFHLQETGGGGRGNKNSHSARLTLPWAQAENIILPGKNISAARVTINGVSVGRGYGSKNGEAWNDAFFSGKGNTNVNVGSITIEGLKINGVDMGTVTLEQLMASSQMDGSMQAKIAKIAGTNASAGGASAEAFDVAGLEVAKDRHGNLSGGVASANATGVNVNGTTVDSAHVSNARGSRDATGAMQGSVDAVAADGIRSNGVSVRSASATGITGSQDANGLVRANVTTVNAQDVNANGVSIGDTSATDIAVAHNSAGTNANVGGVRVADITTANGSVSEVQMQKLAVQHNGKGTTVNAASAGAKGLKSEAGSVDSVALQDLAVTNNANGIQGTAGSGTVRGVQAGGVSVPTVNMTGLSGGHANGVTTGGVQNLTAPTITTPQGTVQDASVDGVTVRHADGVTNAGVESATTGTISGANGSVDSTAMNGLTVQHGNGTTTANLASASATGITSGDNGAASASVRNVAVSHGPNGTHGTAEAATVNKLRAAGVTVSQLDVSGLAGGHADGQTTGGVESVKGRDIKHFFGSMSELDMQKLAVASSTDGTTVTANTISGRDLKSVTQGGVDEITLQKLAVDAAGNRTTANLEHLAASGIRANGVTVSSVSAGDVDASKDGDAISAGVGTLDVREVKHDAGSVERLSAEELRVRGTMADGKPVVNGVTADTLGAGGVSVATDNVNATLSEAEIRRLNVQLGEENTFSAEGASMSGLDATIQGGPPAKSEGPGMDPVDALKLVRDMTAYAMVDLKGGKYGEDGEVDVADGTQAGAKISVKDGNLVPGQTYVALDKPADTAAWTTLRGAYLDKNGRVMADVSGWRDQNLTGQLGLQDTTDRIPLSLTELGKRLPKPDASGNKAAPTESPITGVEARADFTLNGGSVSAGGVQAELAPGNQGQVQYKNDGNGNQEIGLEFAQVLLQSLGMGDEALNLQLNNVNAGQTAITNKSTGTGTMTNAQLKKLQMGNIKGGF